MKIGRLNVRPEATLEHSNVGRFARRRRSRLNISPLRVTHHVPLVAVVAAIVAIVGLAAGAALAQGGEAVDWWVGGGGGGPSTGGDVSVDATLGQAVVDVAQGGTATLAAGYWYTGIGPEWVQLDSLAVAPVRTFMLVTWQTSQEIYNQGFNLYRAESPAGPRTLLNEALIPSQTPPGSFSGGAYQWLDRTVQPDTLYFYWVEEVSLYGQTRIDGQARARTNLPGVGPRP